VVAAYFTHLADSESAALSTSPPKKRASSRTGNTMRISGG